MARIHEMNIRVGDRILIDDGIEGIVVFSSIADDYSSEYPKEAYSGSSYDGIMIEQESGARIFHESEYLESDCCRVKILERSA